MSALSHQPRAAAVARLDALFPLDAAAQAALAAALARPCRIAVRRELIIQGDQIEETFLILSGWAARIHILEDGQRQILSFLLPGDLVGLCDQHRPVASSTVVALTALEMCIAPPAQGSPALASAYAHSRALDEAYLLTQITRLGRLNAHQRLVDLLLELHDRMALAGLAAQGHFVCPMTQEALADALGLTPVHLNRTLQALRRDGLVSWRGRDVVLHDVQALYRASGRRPVRVIAG